MAKFLMRRTWNGLAPADAASERSIGRLKAGDEVMIELKRPRNPQFHRKAMAAIRYAYDNQDAYRSFDALLAAVKALVGPFERVEIHRPGLAEPEIRFITGSLSYADMDDEVFMDWYRDALGALEQLTGIPAATIDTGCDLASV